MNDHDLLVTIAADLHTLKDKVLGNGTPGILQDVAALKERTAGTTRGEKAVTWTAVAMAALALVPQVLEVLKG